jgi:hypothetical protein
MHSITNQSTPWGPYHLILNFNMFFILFYKSDIIIFIPTQNHQMFRHLTQYHTHQINSSSVVHELSRHRRAQKVLRIEEKSHIWSFEDLNSYAFDEIPKPLDQYLLPLFLLFLSNTLNTFSIMKLRIQPYYYINTFYKSWMEINGIKTLGKCKMHWP